MATWKLNERGPGLSAEVTISVKDAACGHGKSLAAVNRNGVALAEPEIATSGYVRVAGWVMAIPGDEEVSVADTAVAEAPP